MLDGIVDVYLPDLKYAEDTAGQKYSHVRSYVEQARAAIEEMWRQVGPLVVDQEGIAKRGLIIRHLVLPNDLADSESSLRWIKGSIGTDVTLSLMAQYYPTHKTDRYVLLNRKISLREYERVVELADRLGFESLLTQEHHAASEFYRPDFSRDHPFHWGETAALFPATKPPALS
jgi:putative pyruvate formate lyase activating enzyme